MPPRKVVSDFMAKLGKSIMESRGVAETTATEYVNQLKQLNGGLSYSNLGFLKKRDVVMAKLGEYADSTKKSMLGAIVSILSILKDKPTYKSIYNFYYERMMEASKAAREQDTAVKSETQMANWITWPEVESRLKELEEEVLKFAKSKMITTAQWNTLLSFVVLALYTLVPPRRNQDYQDLYVVKKGADKLEKDKNYYDLATKKFIFNKYKTSKAHGAQEVEAPEALQNILALYMKLHPNKDKTEKKLLVNADGSALSSVNSITRILNKIFGKQIGSSMLRHIYLSSKYGDTVKEMKEDAEAMGHTTAQQREYVKE
jgi:integrase